MVTYQKEALPQVLVDRVINDAVPARMIVAVDGELNVVVGWPLPNQSAYFEFSSLNEVENTLDSVRLSLLLGRSHHHTARCGGRYVRRPARRTAGRRRRPGRQGDRRRAARHAPRAHRRSRPERVRDLVQRHGRSAAATRRARCSFRIRCEPRAAIAADDVGGVGRGDGSSPRRHARTSSGCTRSAARRRDPVPGSRRGPARDQPIRCRSDQAQPRRAARGRVRPAGRSCQQPARVAGDGERARRDGDHPWRPSATRSRRRQPHRQRPAARRRAHSPR